MTPFTEAPPRPLGLPTQSGRLFGPAPDRRTMPRGPEQQAAADHYLAERVATASPAQLIGMLFDAAVNALHRALAAHEEADYAAAAAPLMKAQDIVLELRCSLNAEAGAMAQSLDSLYSYAHNRLVHANIRKDTEAIREGLAILTPLRDAWRQACLRDAMVGAAP